VSFIAMTLLWHHFVYDKYGDVTVESIT